MTNLHICHVRHTLRYSKFIMLHIFIFDWNQSMFANATAKRAHCYVCAATCDEICSSWTRPSLIVTRCMPIRDKACMCSILPATNSDAFSRLQHDNTATQHWDAGKLRRYDVVVVQQFHFRRSFQCEINLQKIVRSMYRLTDFHSNFIMKKCVGLLY